MQRCGAVAALARMLSTGMSADVSSQRSVRLALWILLIGCSKNAGPADNMVTDVERMRDAVCACRDVGCATTAHEIYRTWKRSPASLHRRELTVAQVDHLGELEMQMQRCAAQRPVDK
jgi:hypothetical protein